jgi:hypothetical protein
MYNTDQHQLSGHNPDTIGHSDIARFKSTSHRFELDQHTTVYQSITPQSPSIKSNLDIIRTYQDMTKTGLAEGLSIERVCSPYPGCSIDISGEALTYLLDNQESQTLPSLPPLLHIPSPICQNTLPHPSFNSPYQGGDLDITGGAISSRPEPQPITSSAVRTAVLHKRLAFRVSDRSGTPQAGNPAEEYSGERDPEASRGDTPKKTTTP